MANGSQQTASQEEVWKHRKSSKKKQQQQNSLLSRGRIQDRTSVERSLKIFERCLLWWKRRLTLQVQHPNIWMTPARWRRAHPLQRDDDLNSVTAVNSEDTVKWSVKLKPSRMWRREAGLLRKLPGKPSGFFQKVYPKMGRRRLNINSDQIGRLEKVLQWLLLTLLDSVRKVGTADQRNP